MNIREEVGRAKSIAIEIGAYGQTVISIDTRGYDIVYPKRGNRWILHTRHYDEVFTAARAEGKEIYIIDHQSSDKAKTVPFKIVGRY